MNNEQIYQYLESALASDKTLLFESKAMAVNFRQHIYRVKKKLKKMDLERFKGSEEVLIQVKEVGVQGCLVFTTAGRKWGNILDGIIPPSIASPHLSPEMQEFKRRADAITPEMQQASDDRLAAPSSEEVMASLGYSGMETSKPKEIQDATNPTEATGMSFDEVYLKAMRGFELTPEEKIILDAGAGG